MPDVNVKDTFKRFINVTDDNTVKFNCGISHEAGAQQYQVSVIADFTNVTRAELLELAQHTVRIRYVAGDLRSDGEDTLAEIAELSVNGGNPFELNVRAAIDSAKENSKRGPKDPLKAGKANVKKVDSTESLDELMKDIETRRAELVTAATKKVKA